MLIIKISKERIKSYRGGGGKVLEDHTIVRGKSSASLSHQLKKKPGIYHVDSKAVPKQRPLTTPTSLSLHLR